MTKVGNLSKILSWNYTLCSLVSDIMHSLLAVRSIYDIILVHNSLLVVRFMKVRYLCKIFCVFNPVL